MKYAFFTSLFCLLASLCANSLNTVKSTDGIFVEGKLLPLLKLHKDNVESVSYLLGNAHLSERFFANLPPEIHEERQNIQTAREALLESIKNFSDNEKCIAISEFQNQAREKADKLWKSFGRNWAEPMFQALSYCECADCSHGTAKKDFIKNMTVYPTFGVTKSEALLTSNLTSPVSDINIPFENFLRDAPYALLQPMGDLFNVWIASFLASEQSQTIRASYLDSFAREKEVLRTPLNESEMENTQYLFEQNMKVVRQGLWAKAREIAEISHLIGLINSERSGSQERPSKKPAHTASEVLSNFKAAFSLALKSSVR